MGGSHSGIHCRTGCEEGPHEKPGGGGEFREKVEKMEKFMKIWNFMEIYGNLWIFDEKVNICGFYIRKLNALKCRILEVCKVSSVTGTIPDFP